MLFVSVAAMLFAVSCSEDDTLAGANGDGKMVNFVMRYGSLDNFRVEQGTRATLPEEQERTIYNMYIFVFDETGNFVYGEMFDNANFGATGNDNYWTADNDERSSGMIHITMPSTKNASIYAVANINNTDIVNVTQEQLQGVKTKKQLENLVASMMSPTVSRNGFFVMSGQLHGVNTYNLNTGDYTMQLCRIDARVEFYVKVADGTDIEEFSPTSWCVKNVPADSYVIEGDDNSSVRFFDSQKSNFEGVSEGVHSFSFYMLENKFTSATAPASQAERAKQVKTNNGDGTVVNGDWVYADNTSTYVVIEGVLKGKYSADDVNSPIPSGEMLNANVRYVIHLGDFTSSLSDFNTLRNTKYIYNVTINGVDDIRVEVESGNEENAPGATGDLAVSYVTYYECDSHYASYVLGFPIAYVDDELTWQVKTPFSKGRPSQVYDVDELDHKWVHFRVNELGGDGVYKNIRRLYDPADCMDVDELVNYLKEEKEKNKQGLDNDFDNNNNIVVTIFVDEYYYETHPLTGVADKDLWKSFVNQPAREMYILCDIYESDDLESSIVGASTTIRQKSIQTIYNYENEELNSAWGCEHKDDYLDVWAYNGVEYSAVAAENRGNGDRDNGRINSCKEWGFVDPDGTSFNTGERWDSYLDLDADNETPLLLDDYRSLRYSCLTRNRDNNGNGVIDEDEVRWYMASIGQLLGIWMGADGVDTGARLYTRTGDETGDMWRQHVVSSTMYGSNSNDPTLVWAEEGSSTGSFSSSIQWSNDAQSYYHHYSVRCVRNLGYDEANGTDITYSPVDATPDDYCIAEGNNNNGYTIDVSRLNAQSLRDFARTNDFLSHDENDEQNRLYSKFEVAPDDDAVTTTARTFTAMNNLVTVDNNPVCPEGYRLPNQRELSIMRYYTSILSSTHFCRTYFSMGAQGTNQKDPTKQGYGYQNGNIFLATDGYSSTVQRCVRDVKE